MRMGEIARKRAACCGRGGQSPREALAAHKGASGGSIFDQKKQGVAP